MTKSKAIVGAPVALVITRDENGVATNVVEHIRAKVGLAQKRLKDVYKKHEKNTSCCLICKEFSKYHSKCPKCNRTMINFGRNVKNPRKGSKTEWREFLNAYSRTVYEYGRELLPCKEYDEYEKEQRIALGRINFIRKGRKRHNVALAKWIPKFDQYLDKHFRNK